MTPPLLPPGEPETMHEALERFFTDTQLNIMGIAGVALYLFGHYAVSRRWCLERDLWNRIVRGLGLTCILLPLFLRWYLSASMLAIAGIMLTVASVYAMVMRHMRGM